MHGMWFYYKTLLNVAVNSRMHLRRKKLDCEHQSVITMEQAEPTKMSGFPRSPGKPMIKKIVKITFLQTKEFRQSLSSLSVPVPPHSPVTQVALS